METPEELGLIRPSANFDCEWCRISSIDNYNYAANEFGG